MQHQSSSSSTGKPNKFFCQFCNYTSTNPTNVKAHETIHTGEKPFQCRNCDFRTGNPGRLSTHRQQNPSCRTKAAVIHSAVEGISSSPTTSNNAHKKKQKKLLKRTPKSAGTGLHKCAKCGRKFQTWKSLHLHLRFHFNPLPYGCKGCKERFKNVGKLLLHKRACLGGPKKGEHSANPEDKPTSSLVCPRCNVKFESLELRRHHISGHNGNKPLLCLECGKWFRFIEHFQQHLNTCRSNSKA